MSYRDVRYRDGGRGEQEAGHRWCDCYGFARLVRADLGLSLLPAYAGIDPLDKRRAARAFDELAGGLVPCEPEPGALVLAYRGRLAIHCGVVYPLEGRLGVIECDAGIHVRWQTLRRFGAAFTRLECYRG